VSSNRTGVPLRRSTNRIEAQQAFLQRILHECRRAERSKQRVLLILIEGPADGKPDLFSLAAPIANAVRETDMLGWYHTGIALGILFTELGSADTETARDHLVQKVRSSLSRVPSHEQLVISAYVLPQDLNQRSPFGDIDERIYDCIQDLSSRDKDRNLKLRLKRAIDIAGSLFLLTVLAPLFAIIAIGVKFGSAGPVLFRQARVGQRGKPFTFLKFRSMAEASDPAPHEDYVRQFIRGTAARNLNEKGEAVFKLTQDPRVTPFGKFLRKTSLDELPQLWNVLRGDMSLVGPRPPIPYEVECYDAWHQRRVLELKPGITGLWQVTARSQAGFDEMVRLDLQYSQRWSLWLDLKILLLTPSAVFKGGGAH